MTAVTVVSLLAVVGLALVHLFSSRLRFIDVTPRSVWLSVFGGISVAYVFVHLLPELAEGQETIAEAVGEGEGLAFLESHIYLVALLGLAIFYGLERVAASSRRLDTGLKDLLLFFVAMALHFVVNDHGLRKHHKDAYLHTGRWVLAAAVVLGWVVGLLAEIPEVAIAVLTAFLAGGVVLNVLKEELPEERESRFWAFTLGAVAYTVLLLAL